MLIVAYFVLEYINLHGLSNTKFLFVYIYACVRSNPQSIYIYIYIWLVGCFFNEILILAGYLTPNLFCAYVFVCMSACVNKFVYIYIYIYIYICVCVCVLR